MDRAEREQRRRRSMDQDRPLLANGLAMIFTGDTHFRFWHIASIGAVQPQVRSRGKIGSDWPTAKVRRCGDFHCRRRRSVMRTLLASAGFALLLALATEPSVSAQEAPEYFK